MILNFKRAVLRDYLELEAEISTANRPDIIFNFSILGGHSVLSIVTGFEGSRRHPHSIHNVMMDWFGLYWYKLNYHKVALGSNGSR